MLNFIGFFQHFMFIVLLIFRVDFLFFARYNKSAIIKHFKKRSPIFHIVRRLKMELAS